jgi:hypothetical protein
MRHLLLSLAVWVVACQPAVPAQPDGTPVAEFSLRDVNPESPRVGQDVNPRDYVGRVSGWYFGHSS